MLEWIWFSRFFITLRTDCSEKREPRLFIKRYSEFFNWDEKVLMYLHKIERTSLFSIWIILSLEPLPNIFIVWLIISTSFCLREQISDIRAPETNKSSMTVAFRIAQSFLYLLLACFMFLCDVARIELMILVGIVFGRRSSLMRTN